MNIINHYKNYKLESDFLNLKPNNIIHFFYLYFFTNYKKFL